MKTTVVIASITLGLLAASQVRADATEPGDMKAAKNPKAKVALAWVDTMFNQCDPKTAFEKYIDAAHYKNHPAAGDGDELKMELQVVEGSCKQHVKFDFRKVIVQGDLVAIQVWVTSDNRPVGTVLTEWMRVKNGRIVDHWDMSREMKGEQRAF